LHSAADIANLRYLSDGYSRPYKRFTIKRAAEKMATGKNDNIGKNGNR